MAHTYNIKYYKVKLLKFDTIQIMQQVTYNFDLVEWYRFGYPVDIAKNPSKYYIRLL